jgi:FkbM family methyltransferase
MANRLVGGSKIEALTVRGGLLQRVCRRVLDRLNGSNNVDMTVNGELTLLRNTLPNMSCVFDVGSNVGDWTAAALAINPKLEIHCFEPNPSTYEALVKRAFPDNVRLNEIALGEAAGERDLYVYGEIDGMNSLYSRSANVRIQRRQRIQCGTIDSYCAMSSVSRIDFLKIDVEGHELSVLRGAERMLSEGRIGLAQFEYGGTYIDARTFLKDLWEFVKATRPSYEFYKLFPDGLRHAAAYSPSFDDFQYSNWVIAEKLP